MLRFNTFRARRYLRTKFVEGKYLLASEASDLELEILDLLRTSVQSVMGDVAIDDAWKVERLTDTTVLIKPGEAWFRGLPFMLRSSKDQLVSGAILTLGTVPVGVSSSDDSSGQGKVITFNNGATTPTNDYRFVITAREELITDSDDAFLKNANLSESTGQKIRLNFRLNIVPVSSQTESPIPYRDENSTSGGPTTDFPDTGGTSSPNFVNNTVVSPTAAGNGELISLTLVPGAEQIDGRDLEIIVRNDPGLGGGNPLPNTPTEQQSYSNGKLVDSKGTEYHLNAMFNDTISTQVVLRIDKEPNQPDPEILNSFDYTVKKRDVYTTDDINGNPQGFLHWDLADLDWDSTNLVSHASKISDLRSKVEDKEVFQNKTNTKDNLILTEGGNITFDSSSGALTWTSGFEVKHPFGTDNTIAANTVNMLTGASLVYQMDLVSGGAIEQGNLAINVTTGGTTITIDSITYDSVEVGNVVVDSAGTLASITSIDPDTDQLTVSTTLVTGAGSIHLDQYAAGTAPLTSDALHLAVRSADRVYFYRGLLELEDGETSQIGDGTSAQTFTYIGSTGESDNDPNYSSTTIVTQSDDLTTGIGKLDAATTFVSTTSNEDRNVKMIAGGTWSWDLGTATLTWSASAFVQRPGFADDRNEISASSVVLNANEVAYVDLNRITDSSTTISVSKATIAALTLTNDRVIIARRDNNDVIVGTHSFRLKDEESKVLDAGMTNQARDKTYAHKSSFFQSDDVVVWTGTQIEFAEDIVLEMLKEDGTQQTYTIDSGDSPVAMTDGQYASLTVDRTQATQTLSLTVGTAPAEATGASEVVIFAKRQDALGVAYLHLPLHKQVLNEGQSVRLGASGSGGAGDVKTNLHDNSVTVLPTGTSVTVDGQSGVNGDLVLFSNLVSNNNRIYELSGVGVAIAWAVQRSFSGDFDPTTSDQVIVERGDSYNEEVLYFDGTDWKANERDRLFEAENFVEEEYKHAIALAASQTDTAISELTFDLSVYDAVEITFRVKEATSDTLSVGTIFAVYDGTDIAFSEVGSDTGTLITFDAVENSGNLEITYTSGGNTATMRAHTKKFLT